MPKTKNALAMTVVAAITGFLATTAFSQVGGVGGFGGGTPEERQKAMEAYYVQSAKAMKEPLGATEEEWKVLEPKIVEFVKMRGEFYTTMVTMTLVTKTDYKLPSESTPDDKKSEALKKTEILRKILLNKDAKPEDIKAALAAFREARDKAKKDLDKAKKNVCDLLTVRHEAILVLSGQLD